MSFTWQDTITLLGGGTIFLGAAAWLIRSIIAHKLALDVETFKAQLQAASSTEIERLRNSLQMVAFEHQVRFSRLHDKRAQVIEELYKLVIDVHKVGQRYVYGSPKDVGTKEYLEVEAHFMNFYDYIENHRIYLPESICAPIEEFVRIIRGHQIRVSVYADSPTAQERHDVYLKAYEAFDKEIPALKKAVTDAFRGLLGEPSIAPDPERL